MLAAKSTPISTANGRECLPSSSKLFTGVIPIDVVGVVSPVSLINNPKRSYITSID